MTRKEQACVPDGDPSYDVRVIKSVELPSEN